MGAASFLHPWLLYALLLILSSYVVIDLLSNHSDFAFLVCSSEHVAAPPVIPASSSSSSSSSSLSSDSSSCASLQAHMKSAPLPPQNPWLQLKWIGPPALCPVKGFLIEHLDDSLNFRRGFSLRFASDVEDKTHLLPWLLATRIDLNSRPRRVYLDLGANAFSTSITWFMRMYPCDFTEIHAFEVDPNLLRKPQIPFDQASNYASPNQWSHSLKKASGAPQWMLDRISIYNKFVSDRDDEPNREVNITRFIKEELKLKAEDTVVVKMDIEGSEWPILRRWMEDPDMAGIVDELFVEVHYDHQSMWGYHWARFAPTTREEAKTLLAELRWHGFFAHPWP